MTSRSQVRRPNRYTIQPMRDLIDRFSARLPFTQFPSPATRLNTNLIWAWHSSMRACMEHRPQPQEK